jgi:hypothetical protein
MLDASLQSNHAGDVPKEKVESSEPVRSAVWYGDGNLVLQAENTLFKVHRDVLAARSEVFASMLSVPQPPNFSTEGNADGWAVVHLSDTSVDIEHALRAVYGERRYVAA